MVWLFWFTLIGLLHASAFSFGQLTETDTMNTNLLLSVNGNLATGNVDRILLYARGEAVLGDSRRLWVLKTQNSYRYGTVKSNRTENDLTLVNYIYHEPLKKVYPFVMVVYENSLLKKIAHRMGGGPGVTFVPIRNKTSLLKLSATAFLDRTFYNAKIEGVDSDSNVINTARPTFRIFQRHHFKKRFSFFYEFVDQVSISKVGRHRLVGSAGITYNYSAVVELTCNVNYTHEDLTAIGVKSDDFFLTFGINIHYK